MARKWPEGTVLPEKPAREPAPKRPRAHRSRTEKSPYKPRTGYNAETAYKIIDMLLMGKGFRYIGTRPGMPSEHTLYRWMALHPEFKEAVENARQLSAMKLEDRALEVVDDLVDEEREWSTNQLRAREAALKQWGWSAERRDPGRFGSRMPAMAVVPIQINTNIDLGQEGVQKEATDIYAAHKLIAAGEPIDTETRDVSQSPRELDLRPEAPAPLKKRHKTPEGIRQTLKARAKRTKNGSE